MSGGNDDWRAWVEKADHDFLAIDRIGTDSATPWDIVAFHAQQAAEKYLKAFLVLRGQQPPKVHDLRRLVELCAVIAPGFIELADDAEFLSPLAVFARYPGDEEQPTRADAERGLQTAKRIRDVVKGELPPTAP